MKIKVLMMKADSRWQVHRITPHSRIGAFAPRSAEAFGREVDAADNPASLSLSTRCASLHLRLSGS